MDQNLAAHLDMSPPDHGIKSQNAAAQLDVLTPDHSTKSSKTDDKKED